MLRRDARAGIAHRQADKFPAPAPRVVARVGGIEAGCVRGDEQLTAAGHGVSGVNGEVKEHLLQHAGIGLDEGQRSGITAFQVDVFADDRLSILVRFCNHIIEHQRLGLHHLFAAEDEQLPGEVGGAFGGADDVLQAFIGCRRELVHVHQQQFGVATDDGEHVVEVVRHPASKLADGFHLLRLAQLFARVVCAR